MKPEPAKSLGKKYLIIPDCQVKAGVDLSHLDWVGQYIVEKKPDVIVNIGDFADMPSLSSYDKGKKSFEGRRYMIDVNAAIDGMTRLTNPLREYNAARRRKKLDEYQPRMILTLGNHEERINRAIEEDARLEGTISIKDLRYEEFGWEVYPFLKVVKSDGIEFSHYFTSGSMGRPVASAQALLRERMGSAVMGHTQITDVAFHKKTQHVAMFVGCCYLHDEDYLTPQGNSSRRQVVMLHEVKNGFFDPMFVSLGFLARKYHAPKLRAA